jgi:PPOX class probable F420-dependent enzyme
MDMGMNIPESHLDLLTQPIPVAVVTLMPDGTPQASVVWRMWEAPYVLVSSPKLTQKIRNVMRDPRLTFLMVDPQNSFRYLEIRSVVTDVRPDPDYAFLEKITHFYMQKPYYGGMEPLEHRGTEDHLIIQIAPQKVRVHG